MESQKSFRLEDLSKLKKEDLLGNVSVLGKADNYFKDRVLSFLRKEYLSEELFNLDFIDFEGPESMESVDSISNISLLQGYRFCLFRNIFSSNKEENKKNLEYIKEVASRDSKLIVLFMETEEKNIRVIKKIFNEGLNIFTFKRLNESEIISFVVYHFKCLGKNISRGDAAYLTFALGYNFKESQVNLQDILNHINLIGSYQKGDEITREDIDSNIEKSIDTYFFTFFDSIFNDRKNAYSILEELVYKGFPEYQILGSIISNLEFTLKVHQLKNQGKNNSEIAKILNVSHEFRIRKALNLARGLKEEQIVQGILHGYEVDENIRFGVLQSKLAMELYLSKLFIDLQKVS